MTPGDRAGTRRSRCASRGSSRSSTRSSRCRSPTSAPSSRSTGSRARTICSGSRVAMVGARSLAMALNRLIDARDRRPQPAHGRPRAARRACSRSAQVLGFCVGVARALPRRRLAARPARPLALADPGRRLRRLPVPEARAPGSAHLWLGAVDGLAPVGAWVAIRGELPWQAWVLGGAVAVWVAGFDLFYALFDVEVDRRRGCTRGRRASASRGAFLGARLLHVATVGSARRRRPRPAGRRSLLARRRRRWRCCSRTSTCSSVPATCAGSTRRSSP